MCVVCEVTEWSRQGTKSSKSDVSLGLDFIHTRPVAVDRGAVVQLYKRTKTHKHAHGHLGRVIWVTFLSSATGAQDSICASRRLGAAFRRPSRYRLEPQRAQLHMHVWCQGREAQCIAVRQRTDKQKISRPGAKQSTVSVPFVSQSVTHTQTFTSDVLQDLHVLCCKQWIHTKAQKLPFLHFGPQSGSP